MSTPSSNKPLLTALYVNAAFLLSVLVVLVTRSSAPSLIPGPAAAFGQNTPSIAGGAGIFVMPAQFSTNIWGCYLLDVDSQTLCAYEFFGGEKQLRLIAARNFRFDRRLSNFNTTPAPQEVNDLLDKEQKSGRVREQNNAPVSPEAPKSE